MKRRLKPKPLTEVERLRKENIQLKEIMRKKLFYIGCLAIRLEKEFATLRDKVNRTHIPFYFCEDKIMKAIIEIELEIDGQWKPSDKDILIDKILENVGAGAWEIEAERLLVFPNSMTCRITRSTK